MKTETVHFQREAHAILAHKYTHFPTVYKKTEWELIENSGSYEHLKIVTRAECWNSKKCLALGVSAF